MFDDTIEFDDDIELETDDDDDDIFDDIEDDEDEFDEANESFLGGLFDQDTPVMSKAFFEDLFKPAYEAVVDDDLDGDILEDDPDIDDDDLDGYIEPTGEYSDAEYEKDEALLEE